METPETQRKALTLLERAVSKICTQDFSCWCFLGSRVSQTDGGVRSQNKPGA